MPPTVDNVDLSVIPVVITTVYITVQSPAGKVVCDMNFKSVTLKYLQCHAEFADHIVSHCDKFHRHYTSRHSGDR